METERLQQLFYFLELAPHDPFTLYSIGQEYLQLNDTPQAIVYFRKVIVVDPGYVGVYYHLGKSLESMGEKEEAIAVYTLGIEQASLKKERNSLREIKAALHQALGLDEDE